MATPVAAAAVGKLVEMMSQPLANEASLLFNFREDFQWVARELNLMKAYLEDADQKSTQSAAVKQWIGELRDVVFDAEDIMDECAAKSLSNPFSCSGLIFKYKIGRRIRDLKGRMKSIDADATRLQLLRGVAATEQASTSSSGAEKWKRSSLLESNARPVAIEPKVDEILGLLGDAAHRVIAVVGMGGVGKTFLLQNVYNDPRTKMMFDKCIWLSISQTYTLQKLQSDIAYSLDLGDAVVAGHLTEQRAAQQIHESLDGKKFLIVLDDVWRATEEDNLIERLGIPVANTQCKIVVTTRSIDVCTRMNASPIYHMEVLQEEDSWDLFCLYAFYPDNRPPPHLKEIARQIERECGKLPLALKTVGALAASMGDRERTGQWEFMLKKLKAVRKPDPIMEILQLSYDFLPAHLKPCFLYFAFFGEDEKIDVEYLINLWRAEGFVPEGDDWREIGLDWYYQLCNLCLVERENDWLNEYCKIHDLVRDLAIYICRENKCAFTLDEGCTKYSSSCTQYLSQPDKSSGCRRMFLAKQPIKDDQISDRRLFLPTVLRTFSLRKTDIENIPASFFSKVRALRVLDLSGTYISILPNSIGRLKLLRVLNLSDMRMKKVPPCIRSLKNLRTLIMYSRGRESSLRVPDWIGELKCLEHLEIPAKYMPKTISKLHSLRTLSLAFTELSDEDNGLLRLEDVGNLVGLEELTLDINSEAELLKMEEGVLERLVNMRKLTIYNEVPKPENGDDDPVFPEKLTSMKHLEYLNLRRFIVPSSGWICEFINLTVLKLDYCDCSEYPAVESLPNLITLYLCENSKCREMRKSFGKCGAFPKLRFLLIFNFPLLEEFPVLEDGSMPCLEKFIFTGCSRVGRVEGLEQLKSLKEFDFRDSGTDECRERLKEEGEEWKKIKANNPRVRISLGSFFHTS